MDHGAVQKALGRIKSPDLLKAQRPTGVDALFSKRFAAGKPLTPRQFTCPAQIKALGGPARRKPGGARINAWTMEQSKKLWGELNHRSY